MVAGTLTLSELLVIRNSAGGSEPSELVWISQRVLPPAGTCRWSQLRSVCVLEEPEFAAA